MKNSQLFGSICASAVLAIAASGAFAQGTIRTIAGSGAYGFAGDGGPALSASFAQPYGVATDAAGNIYIADKANHRARKVDAITGLVSTIAGNGTMGFSGMGGPALSASMEYPNSIFVDAMGNYYMSDNFADAAYKVSGSTGFIDNNCGDGHQGDNGDGGDGHFARMKVPAQVTLDAAGNVYIADLGNSRIRRVDAATHIVTTVAGYGMWGFSPNGTPALSCQFGSVSGVCVDRFGTVYISDAGNHVVRKIDALGRVVTIAGNGTAGYSGDNGFAVAAQLSAPGQLFINDAGNLFITDYGNNTVRVVNVWSGRAKIHTVAGTGIGGFSGDGGSPLSAQLSMPMGVWQDAAGTIYIADAGNNRIRMVTSSGYREAPVATAEEAAADVTIFPNPSKGNFTVVGSSLAAGTTVDVYNVLGAKVYSNVMTGQSLDMKLDQPAGLYNVILRTGGNTSVQKIVIE